MSQIRQDQAQLIITIDAKESQEYQKTLKETAKGIANIKKLELGTKDFNKALEDQVRISKSLASADYSKLSLKQLQDRRSQLVQLQRVLPAIVFAEQGFERELQNVNGALATNAQRTRAVRGALQETGSSLSSLIKGFVKIAAPGAILGGLAAIGKRAISASADMKTLEASFATLVGGMDKAQVLIKKLNDFSLATPFTPEEVNQSAKTLLGFGRSADDVTEDLKILGQAAAATGAPFKSLALVFGQVAGVGKLLGNDVLQFINAGVPVYQVLAEHMNVSVAKVKELQQSGKITFDVLRQAFKEAGSEGGKFAGALELQSKTVNGLLSTLKGTSEAVLVALGSKFEGVMSRSLSGLIKFGNGLKELISPTKTVAQETKELQNEFNNEIGVLKRLSPHAEGRKELIDQINEKYKDYLPNLIKESDGLKEIEAAQKEANKAFQEKLILIAFEEEYKAQIDKTKQAVKLLAGAEMARARAAQTNENLSTQGATASQLEQQKKISEGFVNLVQNNAQAQIDGNEKALSEIEAAYDKTAKRIGSSLDAIRKKFAQTSTAGTPTAPAAGEVDSKAAEAARKKREKELEKARKKREEELEKERKAWAWFYKWIYETLPEQALQHHLKIMDEGNQRELDKLQERFLQGLISENEYNIERSRITTQGLADRIAVLDKFGREESDQRRKLNIQLLEEEKRLVAERAKQIGSMDNPELSELESKFANQLILEEEYNQRRLTSQFNFLQMQMQMLSEAGLEETEVFKQIQSEKLKTQIEINRQRTENEQRTKQMMDTIQKEGMAVMSDFFSLGAELLSQDERQRRKHASAIKAFESSAILVNAFAEVSEYAKQSAKFGPIAGPLIATARSISTMIRAGIAISKINAEQFATGGRIKSISGQLITESPNINTLPGGDNVLIAAKAGEVVLNEDQQRMLGGADTFRRIGVPGFNSGGIVPMLPSTTPTFSSTMISGATSAPVLDMSAMNDTVSKMAAILSSIPDVIQNMNLKTHVVYNDIKKANTTMTEIQRLSSY